MVNYVKYLIKYMGSPVQRTQKGESPSKTASSLKDRVVATVSPVLSFLANLHSSPVHLVMGMLMKVMLLTTAAGTMSATQDDPWLRRGMLLIALLAAGFTLSRLLKRKYTGWTLLFRCLSLLFTAGMIIWSIATFGF
jgi:hypothetical protein